MTSIARASYAFFFACREYRGSRVNAFDGIEEGGIRASPSYSSHEIDEHDNDRALDGLQDRVNLLKRVSCCFFVNDTSCFAASGSCLFFLKFHWFMFSFRSEMLVFFDVKSKCEFCLICVCFVCTWGSLGHIIKYHVI